MLVSATPPFDGDNDKEIIYNVKKFNYTLDSKHSFNAVPQFENISVQLKDLLKRIFVPDEERITIKEIFEHPWMKIDVPNIPLHINFHKMASFTKYSKVS